MSVPAFEFTFFPKLSPELRRAVWIQCLPHRVIEGGPPCNYDAKYCELDCTTNLNTRYPVITRVCRESREVAFENGGPLRFPRYDGDGESTDDSSWDEWADSLLPRQWFSPARDIFHLSYDGDSDNGYNPIPDFLPFAAKCSKVSILTEILSGSTSDLPSNWANTNYNLLDKLDRQQEYLVTIDIVTLHVSFGQALNSGLFGGMVEERVKLINATDKNMIAKYHQLWSIGPQLDRQPHKFFEKAFSQTKPYDNEVQRWREVLETRWVRNKWVQIRNKKFLYLEDPEQLWLETRLDENSVPIDVWVGLWPGIDDQIRPVANPEHPWVKKVLKDMPRFSPVIMFRFCKENCYLHKGPGPVPLQRALALRARGQGRGRGRGRGV